MHTTKAAPAAVIPHVNKVPKNACSTGEYPGNMVTVSKKLKTLL